MSTVHTATITAAILPSFSKMVFLALCALAFYSLGVISSRRKARRDGNWKYLDPGFILISIGVGLAGFAAVLVPRVVIPTWTEYLAGKPPEWGALFVPPTLVLLAVLYVSMLIVIGYRFNDKGFEIRCFHSRTFVRWRDVKVIKLGDITTTGFRSAKVVSKAGKNYEILTYMRGFRDMIRTAKSHGVLVED